MTSWRRPKMTFMGRPNLPLNGLPWEVDSGHPQDVLRTSLRGPSEYSNTNISIFNFQLFDSLNLSKSISTLKVY